jgi:hypothetical protein
MRAPALRGTQLRAPGPGPVRIHANPSVPTVPSTTVGMIGYWRLKARRAACARTASIERALRHAFQSIFRRRRRNCLHSCLRAWLRGHRVEAARSTPSIISARRREITASSVDRIANRDAVGNLRQFSPPTHFERRTGLLRSWNSDRENAVSVSKPDDNFAVIHDTRVRGVASRGNDQE